MFPELRAKLTEDDWRHLEQTWQHRKADDPLFIGSADLADSRNHVKAAIGKQLFV